MSQSPTILGLKVLCDESRMVLVADLPKVRGARGVAKSAGAICGDWVTC